MISKVRFYFRWECWLTEHFSILSIQFFSILIKTALERSSYLFKDRCHISLLVISEFKQINYILLPLKSSESLWFSDNFRGYKSYLICLNSLNIRSKLWQRSFNCNYLIRKNLLDTIWTHFLPHVSIYTPWKHLKSFRFWHKDKDRDQCMK